MKPFMHKSCVEEVSFPVVVSFILLLNHLEKFKQQWKWNNRAAIVKSLEEPLRQIVENAGIEGFIVGNKSKKGKVLMVLMQEQKCMKTFWKLANDPQKFPYCIGKSAYLFSS